MENLFYASAIILLESLAKWIFYPKKMTSRIMYFDEDKNRISELGGVQKLAVIYGSLYMFLGLLTWQWHFFALILLIRVGVVNAICSFNEYNRIYTLTRQLYSILLFAALIFLIINNYCLKIRFSDIF